MKSPRTFVLQRLQELASSTSGEAMVLRLTVEGGGCSGYTYNFTLESETRPDDRHASSTHATSGFQCAIQGLPAVSQPSLRGLIVLQARRGGRGTARV